MQIRLGEDEIAYLCGHSGTVAMARTLGDFFYMDTDHEEVVIFTEEWDLIVASSFGTGEKVRRGLKCTIYQIREMGMPLIVLPKGHPASPRLTTVVSIGPRTKLSCKIQPGTHPEQDVLCGSPEFEGLEVLAGPEGPEVEGFCGRTLVEKL